ncbi:MAG: hypothetical protein RBU37_12540 [Myxococcota bacterium]|jgi:hypothetical protein|nr:hypothetical protein [Myxococcota bacterium]
MEKLTGEELSIEGNAATTLRLPYLAYAAFWYYFEYSLRLGLPSPCELGIEYGVLAESFELRCAMLSESRGAPVSLSMGAAASYQPILRSEDWLYRLSLELSSELGSDWGMSAGAFLSRGPYAQALGAELAEKFVGAEADLFLTVDPYIYVEQEQSRLSLSLGLWYWLDSEHFSRLHFGVQPYFVLQNGELLSSECVNCYYLEAQSLQQRFGFATSVGIELVGGQASSSAGDAPAGYHWERGWNEELLILSLTTAGFAYSLFVPAIVFAVEAERTDLGFVWFVPIAGPLLWQAGVQDASRGTGGDVLFGILGVGTAVLQSVALVSFIEAWVYGERQLVADDTGLTVLPVASGESLGVSALGRF